MNRLKYATCYLAGPMDHARDRGEGWRQEITPFLKSLNVGVYDPTNKATFGFANEDLDHLQERYKLIDGIKAGVIVNKDLYDKYHELMKDVVSIDLRMVDISSFILLYVDLDIYACGTYIEVATSALQRKPIITCVKQGKVNCPPFLMGLLKHEMIFSNFNEVKNYINHINSDSQIDTLGRWKFFNYDKIFNLDNRNS